MITRRRFISTAGPAIVGTSAGLVAADRHFEWGARASVFIAEVESYRASLAPVIRDGLQALGVGPGEIKDKRVLLKPNLVEPRRDADHINAHPLLIRAVAENLLRLGARSVIVGEATAHRRDVYHVLDASGLGDVLYEDRIPFVDLNVVEARPYANQGRWTALEQLFFPRLFDDIDWIVSLAKLKTHHWAGATLSMKNLFGAVPGVYYGWPKNVFHQQGINASIVDIAKTLKPHFAIVDGIVGMEGDGPIMGQPKKVGALVMGRNLAAVDATAARIMQIDPIKMPYLRAASGDLGPIFAHNIEQRGASIRAVQTPFLLLDRFPAQRGLRLTL